jgi:hypothetical protein
MSGLEDHIIVDRGVSEGGMPFCDGDDAGYIGLVPTADEVDYGVTEGGVAILPPGEQAQVYADLAQKVYVKPLVDTTGEFGISEGGQPMLSNADNAKVTHYFAQKRAEELALSVIPLPVDEIVEAVSTAAPQRQYLFETATPGF